MRRFKPETQPHTNHMFLGRCCRPLDRFLGPVSQLPAVLATGENFENCRSQPWFRRLNTSVMSSSEKLRGVTRTRDGDWTLVHSRGIRSYFSWPPQAAVLRSRYYQQKQNCFQTASSWIHHFAAHLLRLSPRFAKFLFVLSLGCLRTACRSDPTTVSVPRGECDLEPESRIPYCPS
jgi:hypothetical protein